jgi:hypothetical protein
LGRFEFQIGEQSLAGDQEGRAKKLVAKCQVQLRPPFLSPEAGRYASTPKCEDRVCTLNYPFNKIEKSRFEGPNRPGIWWKRPFRAMCKIRTFYRDIFLNTFWAVESSFVKWQVESTG